MTASSEKDVLSGWGEIERYMRMTRPTILRKGYPIRKEIAGIVWALRTELEVHRLKISRNISKSFEGESMPH